MRVPRATDGVTLTIGSDFFRLAVLAGDLLFLASDLLFLAGDLLVFAGDLLFFAGDLLFFAGDFLAGDLLFFAGDFLTGDFFVPLLSDFAGLFERVDLAGDFFAGDFLAGGFLAGDLALAGDLTFLLFLATGSSSMTASMSLAVGVRERLPVTGPD